ncbi:MAG TPA: DUF47 family protein [Candidatus Melainabacteria bacterium]|jgi:predicted phosphate transport protein (TIGR00153 family)|nr:DUF47 family protein [Candidatus Melainabacteria bacterium]
MMPIDFFKQFFKEKVDFYALLTEQGETTLAGMVALKDWIEAGAEGRCQTVRDYEHKADEQKLDLLEKITATLVTPLDREDIYDLSDRLDGVINGAKATARQIEALGYTPREETLSNMAAVLVSGTDDIVKAIKSLESDLKTASDIAYKLKKKERKLETLYREGMHELIQGEDYKHIIRSMDVYRTMLDTAQKIELVGKTILHMLIKIR